MRSSKEGSIRAMHELIGQAGAAELPHIALYLPKSDAKPLPVWLAGRALRGEGPCNCRCDFAATLQRLALFGVR